MTETEWHTCADPKPMLAFVRDRGTDRQFRLFNCACVRRVWGDLKDERLREAIRVAEQHADGTIGREELGRAVTNANRARGKHDVSRAAYETVRYSPGSPYQATDLVVDRVSWHAASQIVPDFFAPYGHYEGDTFVPTMPEENKIWRAARGKELAAHCQIVRDILGNPFRPVTPNSSWLVPAVTDMAQTIYEHAGWGRMPELADALEAAGCTNSDVLDHCRGAGSHVRGCWVIDLLLGKE